MGQIEAILQGITYDKPGWKWRLLEKGGGFLFQWEFMERDLTSSDPNAPEERQQARKWYISPYMTRSEIIRTAFLSVQQAELHEVAERFQFWGQRIFDPHMDYAALSIALYDDKIGVDNRIPKDRS